METSAEMKDKGVSRMSHVGAASPPRSVGEEQQKEAHIAHEALQGVIQDARELGLSAMTVYLVAEYEGLAKEGSAAVPLPALEAMLDVLRHLADGAAVQVIHLDQELTTQEAAELLNVSRPFLIRLLDEGKLAYRKVGTRRRLRREEVLAFKAQHAAYRRQVLDSMTAQAQELDLQ
jgi:excisionase family DNA binding protein